MTLDNGPPLHPCVFQGLNFKVFRMIEGLSETFFSSYNSGKNDQNVSVV